MSLSRKLPNTNIGRQRAIEAANLKMGPLPVVNHIIHPSTEIRLSGMQTSYNGVLSAVAGAQANLSANTPVKTEDINKCRMLVSHFIQVFNLGVARGKYPAAHRAFYLLDVSSEAVPNLDAEADVLLWAKRIIEGDPQRTLAGGEAMANPELVEVTEARATVLISYTAQNTLAQVLDSAQEALEDLNIECDKLIKRVWDDVEAFYGEESPTSMRNNARQWGVVYVTLGAPATLTGLLKNAGGAPQEGATVIIVETGATTTTNAEGRYSIETTVTGPLTVQATLGALKGHVTVEIPEEHEGIEVEVGDITIV